MQPMRHDVFSLGAREEYLGPPTAHTVYQFRGTKQHNCCSVLSRYSKSLRNKPTFNFFPLVWLRDISVSQGGFQVMRERRDHGRASSSYNSCRLFVALRARVSSKPVLLFDSYQAPPNKGIFIRGYLEIDHCLLSTLPSNVAQVQCSRLMSEINYTSPDSSIRVMCFSCFQSSVSNVAKLFSGFSLFSPMPVSPAYANRSLQARPQIWQNAQTASPGLAIFVRVSRVTRNGVCLKFS